MTEGPQRKAAEPPVTWLSAAEVNSWLSVVRLMTWLPWSIDQQLRRDSDLGMVEYQVLAMLSDSPERTMRMSSLAEVTNASLSRLSHLVKRLEARGLVRREPDPADGRFTNAILTGTGFQTLAEAAPGHVAHVRSLVTDVLSPEQLRRLGQAADRIVSRIDTSEINERTQRRPAGAGSAAGSAAPESGARKNLSAAGGSSRVTPGRPAAPGRDARSVRTRRSSHPL
jgi:DNA-binding MarR family transcriptional regulator